MRRTAIGVIVMIIFTVFFTKAAAGYDIKLIKKTILSRKAVILENTWSLCVTGDKLFLVPDYKAGNVKIFADNGDLLKILGRKGFGPGEFVKPSYSFYNKEKKIFGVLDLGTKKIFFYHRTGKTDFKRFKEIYCLAGATGIGLKGNKLLVSGYKTGPDNTHYDFYYVDTTDEETHLLLPSYHKYGLASQREFGNRYLNKPDIRGIGISAWFDNRGDDVYFAWEGDLKIIKINIKSRKLDFFGKKTPHYVKPTASKALLEARRARKGSLIESEWDKMSYVTNVFAGTEYVLVFYKGPVKKGGASNVRVQFYSLAGEYLADIPVPGNPGSKMSFDKDKNILYSLTNELDDELSEKYSVFEYRISK
jgi:hypothetical protein